MIKVDHELCIGCGACVSLCPNTFKFDTDGKCQVISEDDMECAKRAAESCPVQAIAVN